jgi:hypothetical protein
VHGRSVHAESTQLLASGPAPSSAASIITMMYSIMHHGCICVHVFKFLRW